MTNERAACLNCIDGRIQLPVINWIKEHYPVDCVDMITEPGMNGLLSDKNYDIGEINKKIRISIKNNNATMLFIVGHHDCRGNPVTHDVHHVQVVLAVDRLKKEFPEIDVFGLWVNESWSVEMLGA